MFVVMVFYSKTSEVLLYCRCCRKSEKPIRNKSIQSLVPLNWAISTFIFIHNMADFLAVWLRLENGHILIFYIASTSTGETGQKQFLDTSMMFHDICTAIEDAVKYNVLTRYRQLTMRCLLKAHASHWKIFWFCRHGHNCETLVVMITLDKMITKSRHKALSLPHRCFGPTLLEKWLQKWSLLMKSMGDTSKQ